MIQKLHGVSLYAIAYKRMRSAFVWSATLTFADHSFLKLFWGVCSLLWADFYIWLNVYNVRILLVQFFYGRRGWQTCCWRNADWFLHQPLGWHMYAYIDCLLDTDDIADAILRLHRWASSGHEMYCPWFRGHGFELLSGWSWVHSTSV